MMHPLTAGLRTEYFHSSPDSGSSSLSAHSPPADHVTAPQSSWVAPSEGRHKHNLLVT